MSTLSRLALLFILVPLFELFILIQVGEWVGVGPTVGLVILTGLVGAVLARLEGLRILFRIRAELARGSLPGQAMLDGFAVLIGGVLLLTPGILTDLLGFAFLLPPTRGLLMGRIRRSLERRLQAGSLHIMRSVSFSPDLGGSRPGARGAGPEAGRDPRGGPGEIVVEPNDTQRGR